MNGRTTTQTNKPGSALGVPGFALVTGAASGIGRAIVRLLAKEGCAGIALADINEEAASKVQEELQGLATNPKFTSIIICVDVRVEKSVNTMVAQTVDKFGRIDYAVNCAGIGLKRPLADTTIDEWDRMMGINLTGVFLCLKAEVKAMMTQDPLQTDRAYAPLQRGSIVSIASLAAINGLRHSGAYTAAKHGVAGLTRTAALDYPEVKCNAIVPGYIKTPLTDAPGEMRTNALIKVNDWTPVQRFGLPEEIAEGVVWLLGYRSNFAHGSCLVMDGGYLVH
jgi:NAD(P)-dependent dehydrogenase (short-subunit alcohol dehydrogenase family)